jgi:hypothetical protein
MTRDEWRNAESVATQALALTPEEQKILLESAKLTNSVRHELEAALRRIMQSSSVVVSSTVTPTPAGGIGGAAPVARLPVRPVSR